MLQLRATQASPPNPSQPPPLREIMHADPESVEEP